MARLTHSASCAGNGRGRILEEKLNTDSGKRACV